MRVLLILEQRIGRKTYSERRQFGSFGHISLPVLWVVFAMFLSACSSMGSQPEQNSPAPAPTVYWVFGQGDQNGSAQATPGMPAVSDQFFLSSPEASPSVQMTPEASPSEAGSPTPAQEAANPYLRVTLTPIPGLSGDGENGPVAGTAEFTPDLSAEIRGSTPEPDRDRLAGASQFELQYIYQDALLPGWETQNSWGVEYDLNEKDFVHRGRYGVAVTPVEDYGGMFFNREEGSSDAILREDVAGVSFWINAGENPIFPDDLAITLIGSNQYPYYVKGDTSVQEDFEKQFFSETRLSLLDFNNELQPDTWYQVILWLDELPYDPAYTYITGFYIKNDVGFKQTFYIDDLSLIRYAQ